MAASEHTTRRYAKDFQAFAEFVTEKSKGLALDPVWANESVLARFVRRLQEQRHHPATIRRCIYGVIATIRAQRPGAWPTSALPAEVREALSRKGTSRRAAITEDEAAVTENISVAITETT